VPSGKMISFAPFGMCFSCCAANIPRHTPRVRSRQEPHMQAHRTYLSGREVEHLCAVRSRRVRCFRIRVVVDDHSRGRERLLATSPPETA
jgi:hypothetical protein